MVAAVAPSDLKSVSAMQDEMQARSPGQQVAISIDSWKNACSSEADVEAVFLRVSMLRMLQMLSGSGGLISPWLHDGKPDDAVLTLSQPFQWPECKSANPFKDSHSTQKNQSD